MRIAFLGKGGSGKTTVSSLTARLAPEQFKETYVIDSDINTHMKSALGADDSLVHEFTSVFKTVEAHVRATHPSLHGLKSLPRTLPVWNDESKFTPSFDSEPFAHMATKNRTLLLELGSYSEKTMGWSCHHSSLGKLQLVLSHLNDSSDQLIVADLTAGADVFGVGMLGLFDHIFVVVEPTMKSTHIFNQLRELATVDSLTLTPIANKILDESDLAFIESQIGIRPKMIVAMSNFVRRLERNEVVTTSEIEDDITQSLGELLQDVKQTPRNNRAIYDSMIRGHKRAAANWPKDKFGDVDLLSLINRDYAPEQL